MPPDSCHPFFASQMPEADRCDQPLQQRRKAKCFQITDLCNAFEEGFCIASTTRLRLSDHACLHECVDLQASKHRPLLIHIVQHMWHSTLMPHHATLRPLCRVSLFHTMPCPATSSIPGLAMPCHGTPCHVISRNAK
eukprot:21216-Chlamydomonas_euryale.AAC.29